MRSGRTSPLLMGCLLEGAGDGIDYVVKLRGNPQLGPSGLVCEVVASELAGWFGLSHPEPAIVEVDPMLAELIAVQEPARADMLKKSEGDNFGCRMLDNLIAWPVDRVPAASQLQSAAEIFAFDALIQNPDRRFNNPNLGTVGDRLTIYDHELAFSFRYDIMPNPMPWVVSGQPFWSQHALFQGLRHKALDLDRFTARLSGLPEDFAGRLREVLPESWERAVLPAIDQHLTSVRDHAAEFVEEIRRILR